MSAIFLLSANDSPQINNYEKCFLFHPTSDLFSVGYCDCFRGRSKINLKVYDVINCLNKNLVTHFVLSLEKEKRYDIETLSIDRALNKEKSCRKYAPKASPKPIFNFGK